MANNLEPSSSDSRYSYDVFLSFSGKDTRNTFTDHLYTALVQAGHRTFRDEEDIRTGENITTELVNAIQHSRGSIIVFSKTYAFSPWCLDELVMIMALNKNSGSSSKFVVLPVFYHVDRTNIRSQSGIVGEAFAKHEGRMKGEKDEGKVKEWMEKLNCWREALTAAADLNSPMVLQPDGKESKFIHKIVAVIRDKIKRPVFDVGPRLVGIQGRAKRISKWLEDDNADVTVIGIYGIGGIGKTTIAKYVYNQHSDRFEGRCFLANVREMSKQPNGLASLQNQLVSDLTKGKKEKNNDVDEGMVKIKYAISGKRILLVLDDVDHPDQLKAILGMRDWFFPGSKIVITTRHERLLKLSEVDKMYEVEKLKDYEAIELMSYHAFGKKSLNQDFKNYIEKAVRLCDGLPLALKVVGSSLCGQTIHYWVSALEKLEMIPNRDIVEILKISYDSLQDDHDKNLFLHIACCFIGQEKNCVITILDECEFYTTVGIQNLIDRSLITTDNMGRVTMHQLLQDMGREIVRLESPRYPGKRSRLWRRKETFDVLKTKTGTETIESLVLNMQMVKLDKPVDMESREIYSKRPYFKEFTSTHQDNPQKRRRLSLISWRTGKMPSSDSKYPDLETEAFEKMENLKLLQLYYAKLTGSYRSFPQNLRLLCWHGFPIKAIPSNLPLDSVVSLDMQHSSLQKVWQGFRFLGSLKILNLSYSKGLVETPDFSGTPKLETLLLKGCISLTEVCESIGFLQGLVVLDLEDCKNLSKLPSSMHKLGLQILNLSGCPKAMASLGVPLADDGIPTNSLSNTFTKIVSWNAFRWPWMSKRRNLADICMISPFCLRELYLSRCNLSEGSFPHDLSNLSALDKLVLSNNPLRSLPDCITNLDIGELIIESCEHLHSLCGLPETLDILRIGDNSSLVIVDSIGGCLGRDTQLVYHDCPKLASIDGCFLLKHITEVDKEIIDNLGFQDIELLGKIELNIYEDNTFREKRPIKVSHHIQGMHEFGIFSTFVPGFTLPRWFTETKVTGPSISFMVPPNVRIKCLNLCLLLLYRINQETHDQEEEEEEEDDDDPWHADIVFVKISNKTKDLSWIYCPLFSDYQSDEEGGWLSQWKFGDDELDGGDQVTVTFAICDDFEVKGCGYNLVFHEEEEEKFENYNKKGKEKLEELEKEDGVMGGNLGYYQFRPGSYYLTHRFLFSGHQSEYLRTKKWLHDIFGDSVSAQELERPCWKGWWR